LRSEPSRNVVVTIERAAGETIAAPRPCAARAAISWVSFVAKPATSEAAATTNRPAMNTLRLPSRSASRPPSRRKPPKVRMYAFTTQARFSWEKPSASPMEGRATFTIEASRTMMNWAAASSTSAIQRL
jgi:hypothetical protein